MKIFNIVSGILFVICAGLQYNDPDPLLWIMLYLWVALLCFGAAGNRFNKGLSILTIVLYTGYALFKMVHQDGVLDWINDHQAENIAGQMKAEKPWIEETREFFGLLIAIVVLAINLIYYRVIKKTGTTLNFDRNVK